MPVYPPAVTHTTTSLRPARGYPPYDHSKFIIQSYWSCWLLLKYLVLQSRVKGGVESNAAFFGILNAAAHDGMGTQAERTNRWRMNLDCNMKHSRFGPKSTCTGHHVLSLLFGRNDIFTTMFTARMSMVNYSGVSLPPLGKIEILKDLYLHRAPFQFFFKRFLFSARHVRSSHLRGHGKNNVCLAPLTHSLIVTLMQLCQRLLNGLFNSETRR